MTVISARSSVDLHKTPASSAYSIPQTGPPYMWQWFNLQPALPEVLLEVHQVRKKSLSSLKLSGTEYIATRRKIHCEEAATVHILATILG